jgi:uncharacterized phiE125 gp8 family phage protein
MTEPVSLALARAQCSIVEGDTTWDALLNAYIPAARAFVEERTGRILLQRSVEQSFPCFGRYLELNYRPVVDVTEIAYFDTAGEPQTQASYVETPGRYPYRLYPALNDWWPSVQPNAGVTVTYTAGYDAGEVPEALVQAMLLLIGHWFANREAVAIGVTAVPVPMAVEALCEPYMAPGV